MIVKRTTYGLADLNDGLGTLVGLLRVPTSGTEINDILECMLGFFSLQMTETVTYQ